MSEHDIFNEWHTPCMTTEPCNCRERIDAGLVQHNTRVKSYFTLSANSVGMPWPIETVQVDKGRGKPKASALFASFCPFCGVSLRKPEGAAP